MGYLFLAVVLLFANGFFVAAEFALVKVRSTQLDLRAAEGNRLAVVARSMIDNLDSYLSVTQLGITLASLGLGWVGEPAVASMLNPILHGAGFDEASGHRIALGVSFAGISFLHIVIGEIAPKSLAIARPEPVAIGVAYPMRVMYFMFWPALIVLNSSANAILRLFGIEPAGHHTLAVPADELRQIAAESAAGGQITQGQGALLSNVFTFSDRVAREIMVSRAKVRGIDLRRPVKESLQLAMEMGHSRYPLYDRDLDAIVGILHMKDLTPRLVSGQAVKNLRELARPAIFVPETMSAQRLLKIFQRQRSHMAVVLDEFGAVTGLTTIEDTLEELVGEIQDEHDEERQPIESIEGGHSVEGRVLLSVLEESLGVTGFESEATTLSGYVMESLGRVATVGDEVPIGEWTGRVTHMDKRSIERVELRKSQEETVPGQPGER
jgi:CBS domain containing-hemolysin-like protein